MLMKKGDSVRYRGAATSFVTIVFHKAFRIKIML